MTCPFTLDDGAYVLGALCPGERAEFERHLAMCQPCRESVAALAVLPGLLGRLDAATAARSADGAAASSPVSILPRALAAARRAQRTRRRWYSAVCIAAVWLIVTVGFGVHRLDQAPTPQALTPQAPTPQVAFSSMRPVAIDEESQVTAEIGIQGIKGGTQIFMTCRYVGAYSGHWPVHLVVFGLGAATGEQVGSWMTGATEEVSLTALTHLDPAEIGRVEVQRADHTTLLTWTPQ